MYRGTQVVDGVGQMVVTEVGDDTMLGQIARRLSGDADDEDDEADGAADTEETRVQQKLTISKDATPLQVKLTDLADLISKVGYVAAVAIFLALLVRGLCVGEVRWPGAGRGRAARCCSPASATCCRTSCTWSSSSSWRCPRGCR